MAEWLKAAVLKTAEARASVGSNPTPSASLRSKLCEQHMFLSYGGMPQRCSAASGWIVR